MTIARAGGRRHAAASHAATVAASSRSAALAPDSLSWSRKPESVPMAHSAPGSRLARQALIARFADEAGSEPVVFLNYDETVSKGEASASWTPVGNPLAGPLRPDSAAFRIASSHANGNPGSTMDVGFRLANAGDSPVVVQLSGLDVGPREGAQPRGYIKVEAPGGLAGTARITVPARGEVVVPVAAVGPHPANSNPRDAARMVTFALDAKVVSGDVSALSVADVARFPEAPPGTVVKDAGGPKHHEGVFPVQLQISVPPVLGPDNLAYLKIRGSNAHHDAHYYTLHRAFVAIRAEDPPKEIVFMGPGGMTHPLVGGHPLPAIGDVYDGKEDTMAGKTYQEDRRRVEFALPFKQAVNQGYLRETGQKNGSAHSVYEIDVRFVAGDNGDLGVYGRW